MPASSTWGRRRSWSAPRARTHRQAASAGSVRALVGSAAMRWLARAHLRDRQVPDLVLLGRLRVVRVAIHVRGGELRRVAVPRDACRALGGGSCLGVQALKHRCDEALEDEHADSRQRRYHARPGVAGPTCAAMVRCVEGHGVNGIRVFQACCAGSSTSAASQAQSRGLQVHGAAVGSNARAQKILTCPHPGTGPRAWWTRQGTRG